ncbi:hypothetical protein [Streptomyces sp. NPDC006012]|uniref:hypothetical protein n=1 Tax=Streptomyces sp. NPDC006012 TaxID=3364739 RepID=UPI00368381CE
MRQWAAAVRKTAINGTCAIACLVMLVLVHGALSAGPARLDVTSVGRTVLATPTAVPAAEHVELRSSGSERGAQTPSHPQHWVVRTSGHSPSAPVVTDTPATLATLLPPENAPPGLASADVPEPFQRSALLRC